PFHFSGAFPRRRNPVPAACGPPGDVGQQDQPPVPTTGEAMNRSAPAAVFAFLLAVAVGPPAAPAAEPAANTWARSDAVIDGRRWDVPVGYDPAAKQFVVLGGRSTLADYRRPRSYDVLTLDPAGKWRNELPPGTAWGPETGSVTAPLWKG